MELIFHFFTTLTNNYSRSLLAFARLPPYLRWVFPSWRFSAFCTPYRSSRMSQKSILSFFSARDCSASSAERDTRNLSELPRKRHSVASKRKRVVIESDDSCDGPDIPVNGSDAPTSGLATDSEKPTVEEPKAIEHHRVAARNRTPSVKSTTSPQTSSNDSMLLVSQSDAPVKSVFNEVLASKIQGPSSVDPIAECKDRCSDPKILRLDPAHLKVRESGRALNDYEPEKTDYNPIEDANWEKGSSVPYLSLAKTFEFIESTSGRLKITEALCNFFRSVGLLSPSDLPICIHLCLNRLGPTYEGTELGVGETILLKALGMTTGVGLEHLKASLKKQGDLGTLAENIRSRQKTMFTPKPLTVSAVFSRLKEIAAMSGNAAQTKKVERICSLLVACRESEAKYLIRSLSGKLRIGLAEQTVLTALGQAAAYTPFHSAAAVKGSSSRLLDASTGVPAERWKTIVDNAVANVKKAYCVCPNYDKLVTGLLLDGPDVLYRHCFITPGVPLKPMLAYPTHGISDVLKRFDEADFTCEYKYDGERAQIHVLSPSTIHVYSRNQEDNTSKYPDIVNSMMPKVISGSTLTSRALELLKETEETNSGTSKSETQNQSTVFSCIIDSEVVAWDRQTGQILPFQILSTRKRKDVDEATVKVQVCVYAFDLLYLNDISLIEKPFRIRREILRTVFPHFVGEFMLATSLDSSDTEEIASFMDESIKGNCEGLMVKTLDHNSTYEIAKRSHNWLKLKKDYLDNIGDTLDLVVIGGFHGSGKRAGRYGGFLLACYDPDSEEYQTICKIGTGMKDEELAKFSEFFQPHVIKNAKPYYRFEPSLVPDHWFEPVQVWEVKAADLSISPSHKAAAGLADPEKGISLRFPRFLRTRDDKKPEDATSAQQVYEMYKSQEQIKNQESSAAPNEDELY
ncbi:unnamed protein product [Calicophoron daubneyi]|uniref:DNA ligase n=1 Tax=Calicophoron daubneyi TaxID=300641 RepID=A0AAV2TA61_CALDB